MKCIWLPRAGGPEVLEFRETAGPTLAAGHIIVRVRAAGVNRADLLQRAGQYAAPCGWPTQVPGLEYAGEVSVVGPGVTRWRIGDRVMGLVGGGAYAEYVACPADHAIRVPDQWSFEEAAAVPEAFITAFDALRRGGLAPGERLLVHAVGSSVGTALSQLGRAGGAEVAGTSRSEWKLERAAEYGVTRAILAAEAFVPPDWIRDWADVITDLVGGAYVEQDLVCLAFRGRIVLIGLMGGRAAQISLGTLVHKRATLVGTVLRSRSDDEKSELTARFAREVMPLFATGVVRPVLERVFPMDAAAEAHRFVEANRGFGGVVLAW